MNNIADALYCIIFETGYSPIEISQESVF